MMMNWRFLFLLLLFGTGTLSGQIKEPVGLSPDGYSAFVAYNHDTRIVPGDILSSGNRPTTDDDLRFPIAQPRTEEGAIDALAVVLATLDVSTTALTVDASGGTVSFDITSTTSWRVSESISWLSVSPGSGSNDGSVTVTVLPRNSSSSRSGVITVYGTGVSSKRITVTQTGIGAKTLVVTPPSISAPAAAGEYTVAIASNTTWSVKNMPVWASVSPLSGEGNGTLTVSVQENMGVASRSDAIELSGSGVSDRNVELYQAGIPATLSVSSTSADFTAAGGAVPIAVSSNTSWKVTESLSWLSVAPSSGANDGEVVLTVQVNTSEVARTGIVTLSTTVGTGAAPQLISVTQAGASTTITVSPVSVPFTAEGGTNTFAVTSSINWTVTETADWLEVTPASGVGDATLSVACLPNTLLAPRSHTITITGDDATIRTVTVSQAGAAPMLTVAPEAMPFVRTGGTGDFIVVSNTSWTVSESSSWLSISTTSGSGNGTVTVTCQPNSATSARTAEVKITGGGLSRRVLVTQEGIVLALSISPGALEFNSETGNKSFAITSNTSWSITESLTWASISPSSGKNNGTVTVTCLENLSTEPRSGVLTISGSGVAPQTVAITQAAYSLSLSVSPTALSYTAVGGVMDVAVTASVDWTLTEASDWFEVSATAGTGNASLQITCLENPTTTPRSGTITITGSDGVVRTVSVTQSGLTPSLQVTPSSLSFLVTGGTADFSIASNTAWTLQESSDWLSISAVAGSGDAPITVTTTANLSSSSRSAVIIVSASGASKVSVTITQAGTGLTPYVTVAPALVYAPSAAGTVLFQVESNTTWQVTESLSWVSVSPASGTNNGEVAITLQARTSTSSRSGYIYVKGAGVSSATKVTITQYGIGSGYTLSVSPAMLDFNMDGGVSNVLIASNTNWKVEASEKWVTTSATTGLNNGTLAVTCQPYTGITTRTADISISGSGVTTQKIRVTQTGVSAVLTVSPATLGFNATGGNATFSVASNTKWTVSEALAWLSVSPSSGTNNGTVTVLCASNPDPTPRTGVITVQGEGGVTQVVEITQAAASLTVQVAPVSLGFVASGEAKTFAITSTIDWTVTEIEDWMEVSATSGTGSAAITVTCLANETTSPRSAAVLIVGTDGTELQVTITQAGVVANLTVTPVSLSFPIEGGTSSFQIASNTNWTASSTASWFSIAQSSGTGDASIEVTCLPYTGVYARSEEIVLYGVGVSTQKIKITQAGSYVAPTLTVSTSSMSFPAVAGSQTFTIESNTSWRVSESYSWLTVSPATGSNNAEVVVTVLPRTSSSSRSGTITVYGTGTSSKRITVKQLGVSGDPMAQVPAGILPEVPTELVVPLRPDAWSVYPNPSTGLFQLHALESMTGEVQIRVLDTFGKVLEYRKRTADWMQGTTEALDLSRYQEGLYIVQVISSGGQWSGKVQIVR